MKGHRRERLSKELKRQINRIIKEDFHISPEIIITITDVEMTGDIKHCKVYYSVFSVNAEDLARASGEIRKLFDKNASYFKFVIGKGMRIRNIPDFSFHLDSTPARASKVIEVLDRLKES